MKRVRKAAIVESSGSEEDSGDSDFGETLSDKLKRKRLTKRKNLTKIDDRMSHGNAPVVAVGGGVWWW